jgi:hypothetical protein
MSAYRILKTELRHLREWRAVLKEELREGSALKMLRAICTGRVSPRVWRRRMRTCLKCPIYDRELRRCRGPVFVAGTPAPGCGCYVVYTALTKRPYPAGCWGRQWVAHDFGWGGEQ